MRRSFSLVPASISSVRSRSSVVVPANDHVDEMPTRDDAPRPTADAAVAVDSSARSNSRALAALDCGREVR